MTYRRSTRTTARSPSRCSPCGCSVRRTPCCSARRDARRILRTSRWLRCSSSRSCTCSCEKAGRIDLASERADRSAPLAPLRRLRRTYCCPARRGARRLDRNSRCLRCSTCRACTSCIGNVDRIDQTSPALHRASRRPGNGRGSRRTPPASCRSKGVPAPPWRLGIPPCTRSHRSRLFPHPC